MTNPMVGGLDDPCGVCGRVAGDHTLREWATCMGTTIENLPYAEVPEDIAEHLRKQFQLPDDLIVADCCVVKAATLDGSSGAMTVRTPALIHEYSIGRPGGPPYSVAKVLYVGSPEGMRAYGRLVRDSANGAANKVERR